MRTPLLRILRVVLPGLLLASPASLAGQGGERARDAVGRSLALASVPTARTLALGDLVRLRARVVVATGWEIPDAMPVPLMEGFYPTLAEGHPVAEALRRAKQDAIAAGAFPGLWAAVQVHGDPGVLPVLRARPPLAFPGAGGMGLMLFLAALLILALAGLRRRSWVPTA